MIKNNKAFMQPKLKDQMRGATSHVNSPLDIQELPFFDWKQQGIAALTARQVVTTSNASYKMGLKVFDNTFIYEISSYKDQLNEKNSTFWQTFFSAKVLM